ncbi:unnamed protein product [Parnassius apollo]|uniref:(apollo) hypothetical protein n=1 Tax=Parnassius apollo TaxID=110799 RepID=A0A8S3WGK8_PARAO|nr:unnamed protein product [Parnassius apollo]
MLQERYYFFNGKPLKEIIYEDDQCIVFEELNSQARVHFVVMPKKVISRLSQTSTADEKLLGRLILVAKNIAIQKGLDESGYHILIDKEPRTKLLSLHISRGVLKPLLWPITPNCRL